MKKQIKALAVVALIIGTLVGIPAMSALSFSGETTNPAVEEGKTMVSDGDVELAAVPALAMYGSMYLSATGREHVMWSVRQSGVLGSLARSVWDGRIWASGSDYLQHGGSTPNPEIIFDR